MSADLFSSLFLLTLAAVLTVCYAFRLAVRGRAQYERIHRQGGSVLLGKTMMEMAYWSLQPVARFLIALRVTPNMISWASLVLGGIAGSFLAYGRFGVAALLATVSAFLDSLDGIVARETGVSSDAGEVLDATIDRYVEFFFLGGLVVYYRDIPILMLVSLLALMGSFMVSYSSAKAEAMHMKPPPGIMRRPERAFYLILGAALSPLPWFEPQEYAPIPVAFPMILGLVIVAVLANISAIERLYTVAQAIRMQELRESEGGSSLDTETASFEEESPLSTDLLDAGDDGVIFQRQKT
jgi:CDP-diacylglycerol--glycerol-3-phosphate 3-phosphatidyltransferase